MAEQRTVRVPDEPGWWWAYFRGNGSPILVFHRLDAVLWIVNRNGMYQRVDECECHLWRGPIPEPTDEEWRVSE